MGGSQEGLSGSASDVLPKDDLMLIYTGKVQRGLVLRSDPIYLGLIFLRQHEEDGRSHWVRVGICTWSAAFDQLSSMSPFSGISW